MSVSELRAKFGAAPPSQQNGTAPEQMHKQSSSSGSQAVNGAAGSSNRLSAVGAFGVVLKPTLSPRRGIDVDVNGNDSEVGASATGHADSARPLSPGGKSAAAAPDADTTPAGTGKQPPPGAAPDAATTPGTSAAAKPFAPGLGKPAPIATKPSTLAVGAASGTAGKPAVSGRPVGFGVPKQTAVTPGGAAARQTSASPSASGDAPLSPGVAQAVVRRGAKPSPQAVSPQDCSVLPTSPKSQTAPAAPLAAVDAASEGDGGSTVAALGAARSQLRKVLPPGSGGRVLPPKQAAAAAAASTASTPDVREEAANVVSDSSGARFRKLPYVTPRVAAPSKPDSVASAVLPVVTWPEEPKPAVSSPVHANRAVSLIAPTTEEEEYDDASSGSGSVREPEPPRMPPRLVTGRPAKTGSEAAAAAALAAVPLANAALRPAVPELPQQPEPAAAAAEEDDNMYDDGTSGAAVDDEETFEEYDDIGATPQLPARTAAPLVKSDSKEAVKRQKEEEKKQKAKEKEEKEQKAREKKEKERREKEEQKKEAELLKLLALYKVSATDQPQCEATVKTELLKPGKNELQVKAGERLLILAKDARGKWLAKNSSGAIGMISASNVTVIEPGNSDDAGDGEEYEDVEEVYSVLDD